MCGFIAGMSQSASQTTDCQEVVKIAIEYRDLFKEVSDKRHYRDTMRFIITHTGANLYDDEEIEEILCSMIGIYS